ncbi:MAG: glutathione S-transferase [Rhodobacterales bacterium]|nr:MAG: glutathione S-transferase [Rhodobacterales bacterium]
MLTLYHSPMSRSTSIVSLIEELGADVDIITVTVPRQDGTGARDPRNPHPEGKVPLLVHDGQHIRERGAIVAHLCALYPDAGLAPAPGTADHGRFLSWLFYYQGVMEPVMVASILELSHPGFEATFRDKAAMARVLETALKDGPYLMGDTFSAADLLLHSPFGWMPEFTPDSQVIRDWVARCAARPSIAHAAARDQESMSA